MVTIFAAKGEVVSKLQCPGEFRFSVESAAELT